MLNSISIVLPSYNEEKTIDTSIQSIQTAINYLKNQYNINVNIIVADSSTDSTKQILKKYDTVIVLDVTKTGIGAARKAGTEYAISKYNADVIVSTDTDITHPENWLYKLYAWFANNNNVIAVSGIYKDSRFYESITTSVSNKIFPGLGGNTAFRKESYIAVGGYDSIKSCEDIKLWNKLKQYAKVTNTQVIHDVTISVNHASGYRWRAASVYPISASCILSNITPLKYIGYFIGLNELITHGSDLKEIPYTTIQEIQ